MVVDNVLYYTEDYISDRLIDLEGNLKYSIAKKVELDEETINKLLSLLGNYDNNAHRCMTVYRDAIKINGDIYNICLSCGDYDVNGERRFLHNENEIRELLNIKKNGKI